MDLNDRPFSWLPFGKDDFVDLTCEYIVSLLRQAIETHGQLIRLVQIAIESLGKSIDLTERSKMFELADNFLDRYTRLVKCVKLSLGQRVTNAQSPQKVFEELGVSLNDSLHDVVFKIRNTQQHFEERLQEHGSAVNPFMAIGYNGPNAKFECTFGKGGFMHSAEIKDLSRAFDQRAVYIMSYYRHETNIARTAIAVEDIIADIYRIGDLVARNMEEIISKYNICCPPPRNLAIVSS